MSNQRTKLTCPSCGVECPVDSILCPACRARVSKPFMQAPPRWFIVLLLVIIAALAIYAVHLALQVFVFHKF